MQRPTVPIPLENFARVNKAPEVLTPGQLNTIRRLPRIPIYLAREEVWAVVPLKVLQDYLKNLTGLWPENKELAKRLLKFRSPSLNHLLSSLFVPAVYLAHAVNLIYSGKDSSTWTIVPLSEPSKYNLIIAIVLVHAGVDRSSILADLNSLQVQKFLTKLSNAELSHAGTVHPVGDSPSLLTGRNWVQLHPPPEQKWVDLAWRMHINDSELLFKQNGKYSCELEVADQFLDEHEQKQFLRRLEKIWRTTFEEYSEIAQSRRHPASEIADQRVAQTLRELQRIQGITSLLAPEQWRETPQEPCRSGLSLTCDQVQQLRTQTQTPQPVAPRFPATHVPIAPRQPSVLNPHAAPFRQPPPPLLPLWYPMDFPRMSRRSSSHESSHTVTQSTSAPTETAAPQLASFGEERMEPGQIQNPIAQGITQGTSLLAAALGSAPSVRQQQLLAAAERAMQEVPEAVGEEIVVDEDSNEGRLIIDESAEERDPLDLSANQE